MKVPAHVKHDLSDTCAELLLEILELAHHLEQLLHLGFVVTFIASVMEGVSAGHGGPRRFNKLETIVVIVGPERIIIFNIVIVNHFFDRRVDLDFLLQRFDIDFQLLDHGARL